MNFILQNLSLFVGIILTFLVGLIFEVIRCWILLRQYYAKIVTLSIRDRNISDDYNRVRGEMEIMRKWENVPVATENFVFQDDGNTSDRYASDTRPDDDKDYHEFTLAPIASELMQQIAEAEAEFRHEAEAASPYSDMPL